MGINRATNKHSEALVKNIPPDVCLTPLGSAMVPVPYTITCKFDVAERTAGSVNFGGEPAFTMNSLLPAVKGDERGSGGGVISGVNLGYCRPIAHSSTVCAETFHVVRHGDLMHMNCNGPEGAGNTFGKIIYIGYQLGHLPLQGVIVSQEQTITTRDSRTIIETRKVLEDPETGERTTIVENSEVTADPESGKLTVAQRTRIDGPNGTIDNQRQAVIDPSTGEINQAQISQTSHPEFGNEGSWEQSSYNPAQGSASVRFGPGVPPHDLGSNIIDSGSIAEQGAISAVDTSAAVSDADVMSDAGVQAAIAEQAHIQAQMDEARREMAWLATQTAVDGAGIVDPTPISDLVGASMALWEGDLVGAGLSIVSIIPWFGDAVAKPTKGARILKRVKTVKQAIEKLTVMMSKAKDKTRKAIDAAKKRLSKSKDVPDGKQPRKGDGGHVPKKNKERCASLRIGINKLIKELNIRGRELKENPDNQPMVHYGKTRKHAQDVFGHARLYSEKRAILRKRIAQYRRLRCGALPLGAVEAAREPIPYNPVRPNKPNLPD